jgi:hypothetical protein
LSFRSLVSMTSLATLCDCTADGVTISSSTFAPSSAFTTLAPQRGIDAALAIHRLTPAAQPGREIEDARLVLARIAQENLLSGH